MNSMKYKGYIARVEFDDEDRLFVGHLAGIRDIVGFHGTTVDELEAAFHETVDRYISISEETGRPAQKPSSGKILLRVPPEIHQAALGAAVASGISLNQWAAAGCTGRIDVEFTSKSTTSANFTLADVGR